jgi:hypothetical protein
VDSASGLAGELEVPRVEPRVARERRRVRLTEAQRAVLGGAEERVERPVGRGVLLLEPDLVVGVFDDAGAYAAGEGEERTEDETAAHEDLQSSKLGEAGSTARAARKAADPRGVRRPSWRPGAPRTGGSGSHAGVKVSP